MDANDVCWPREVVGTTTDEARDDVRQPSEVGRGMAGATANVDTDATATTGDDEATGEPSPTLHLLPNVEQGVGGPVAQISVIKRNILKILIGASKADDISASLEPPMTDLDVAYLTTTGDLDAGSGPGGDGGDDSVTGSTGADAHTNDCKGKDGYWPGEASEEPSLTPHLLPVKRRWVGGPSTKISCHLNRAIYNCKNILECTAMDMDGRQLPDDDIIMRRDAANLPDPRQTGCVMSLDDKYTGCYMDGTNNNIWSIVWLEERILHKILTVDDITKPRDYNSGALCGDVARKNERTDKQQQAD